MTFTKDQLETLSRYEQYFHTATKANYTRNPGRTALAEIHQIYTSATGSRIRLNTGCGQCIFSLVKSCAVAYYKDKDALAKMEEQKKEVKADDEVKVLEVKHIAVKTKSRSKNTKE